MHNLPTSSVDVLIKEALLSQRKEKTFRMRATSVPDVGAVVRNAYLPTPRAIRKCVADLKKCGIVKFMGMKLTVKKAPAKPRRKGINPFPGEEQWFAAKPASKKVRARALKKLNDQV